jgi:hypothetical protein
VQSSGGPQGSRKVSPPVGCLLATLLFAAALNVGIFVINVLPFDFTRHRSIDVIWTALAYHACVRFPDDIKEARVFPVFKPESRDFSENYRPLSTLLTISKKIERHIGIFSKYKNNTDRQSGFRKIIPVIHPYLD